MDIEQRLGFIEKHLLEAAKATQTGVSILEKLDQRLKAVEAWIAKFSPESSIKSPADGESGDA